MKKAMILAAGLGTRLRPLTHIRPKPLVPINNQALLVHHLKQLANVGVEEVMINVHYLPEKIQNKMERGEKFGLKLHFSVETPSILGTGGGLSKVAPFFEKEKAFLFINGDILHDIDLQAAYLEHKKRNAVATLLSRPHPLDEKTGWIGENQDQWIKRVPDMPETAELQKRMFTGIHILTPEIFSYLPKKEFGCILRTGYRSMIEKGLPVHSHFIGNAFWIDIGTPASYMKANWKMLDREGHTHSNIAPTATIAPTARLEGKMIIGASAIIHKECQLKDCIIWPNAEIPSGTKAQNTIFFGKEKQEIRE